MFMLDDTDVLEAWASVDAKIDCIIDGYVGAVYTNLFTGTLSNGANTHVYVAGTDVAVVNSRFTNTHNVPVTLSFKMDPTNGGNPKWLTPVDVSLEAGYTLLFDGQRCTIIDTSGRVVQSVAVSDAAYGAGWNGITDTAASKNAIYDQMELRAPKASPTFTGVVTAPTINLTGGQIAFPATAVPSGDPNTIDDYEEGTWTPVVQGAGDPGTYEIITIVASYTKIGRLVCLICSFVLDAVVTGGGTSYCQIAGAPFENGEQGYGTTVLGGVDFTGTQITALFIAAAGTTILYFLETVDGGAVVNFPISAVVPNARINFSMTYFT